MTISISQILIAAAWVAWLFNFKSLTTAIVVTVVCGGIFFITHYDEFREMTLDRQTSALEKHFRKER